MRRPTILSSHSKTRSFEACELKKNAGDVTGVFLQARTLLHCFANLEDRTVVSRNATFNEKKIALGINFDQFQVLDGHAFGAHLARHLFTLENVSWSQSGSD